MTMLDVADAEDVVDREPRGRVEHVAEEAERRVAGGAPSSRSPALWAMPAAAIASGSAGMTPPLVAIAAKFSAPPSAITSRPGMWRLATRKAPSRQ